MDVHFGGAVLRIEPEGPGHFGQGGQEAAVHGREAAQGFGFLAVNQGERLRGDVADKSVEQLGIEDAAGFAQGAAGDSVAAEQTLHFIEFAGLLDAAQALDDGVEEEEQEQTGVLVIEQATIAGVIAYRGVLVQTLEQGPEQLEILESLEILVLDRCSSFRRHGLPPRPNCQSGGN